MEPLYVLIQFLIGIPNVTSSFSSVWLKFVRWPLSPSGKIENLWAPNIKTMDLKFLYS
eukprot:m.281084 g.281084  ORF g.281084 m.281084 type:complete len:58 (+) comp150981_c0_seq1:261-434(+)